MTGKTKLSEALNHYETLVLKILKYFKAFDTVRGQHLHGKACYCLGEEVVVPVWQQTLTCYTVRDRITYVKKIMLQQINC